MIAIYKPQKNLKGHGCSFKVVKQKNKKGEDVVYINFGFVKQSGNQEFQPKDKSDRFNGLFSPLEAAGIIDCVDNNRPLGYNARKSSGDAFVYHSGDTQSSTIKFVPYFDKDSPDHQLGFSFSVNRKDSEGNNKSFFVGLSFAEAIQIREFLRTAISVCNQFEIKKQQVKEDEFRANKKA